MKTASPKPLMYYALDILSRRRYSIVELRKKLALKGGTEEEMDKVVTRLIELKYLDDDEFAYLFLENELRRSPQGLMAIKKKLKAKGISSSIIEKALSRNEIDELAVARTAMQKKLRNIHALTPQKLQQKIFRFLVSRGFSSGIALKAIKSSKSIEEQEIMSFED